MQNPSFAIRCFFRRGRIVPPLSIFARLSRTALAFDVAVAHPDQGTNVISISIV
jgi:hypothetical protein